MGGRVPGSATLRWGFPAGSSEYAQFAAYWFRGALARWHGREAARDAVEALFTELVGHAAQDTRGPISVVVSVAPHVVDCRIRVRGQLDSVRWPPPAALDAVGLEDWAYGTAYWFRARA